MAKSLDFTLSLTDKFSKPMRGIQKSVSQIDKMNKRFAGGAIALFGIAKGIASITAPAQAMQSALQNAKSAGVEDLDKLRKKAKEFSNEYGTSALDFVNSTAGVKNALNGISDKALPYAVKNVQLLAKATGLTADQSTKYLEDMVGDYYTVYAKMGRLNFSAHVNNMAAYAKQKFNLDPKALQDALKISGAQNKGVDMNEQMVTIGILTKTSGVNAGKEYGDLLNNIESAGKRMGLSFTDAQGKMLAMPAILEKIKSKYGDNEQALKAINQTFGSSAGAMRALISEESIFNDHLTALSSNSALEMLEKQAQANINPWEKINAQLDNTKESMGAALLPTLMPILEFISKMLGKFAKWAEMFPNLSKWIGILVVGLGSFAAIGAIIGMVTSAFGSFAAVIKGVTAVTKILNLTFLANPIVLIIMAILAIVYILYKNWDAFCADAMATWDMFCGILENLGVFKAIGAIWNTLKAVFYLLCYGIKAGWNWVIELLADLGVFKAIGAIWDSLKAGFFFLCDGIKAGWNWIIELLADLGVFKAIGAIWDTLKAGWAALCALFTGDWDGVVEALTNNKIFKFFVNLTQKMGAMFKSVVDFIKNIFIDSMNWIIDKANMLPGVNIDLIARAGEEENAPQLPDFTTGTALAHVEAGGISKEINNAKSTNVDNSQKIGAVNIQLSGSLSPDDLREWEQLQNG